MEVGVGVHSLSKWRRAVDHHEEEHSERESVSTLNIVELRLVDLRSHVAVSAETLPVLGKAVILNLMC